MSKYRVAFERLKDHASQLQPYRVVGDYPHMETTEGDFDLIYKLIEFHEVFEKHIDCDDLTLEITQEQLEDLLLEVM